MANWDYIFEPNWWMNPETDVVILDQDMPVELRPE